MQDFTLTIGQYINKDSWIHRLDPRFKIASVILLMVAFFMLPNLLSITIAIVFLFLLILSARIPLKPIFKGLKPIIFLSIFSFILQLIYSRDGSIITSFDINFSVYHIVIILTAILLYIFTSKFIPFKSSYFLLLTILVISSIFFLSFPNALISNFTFNIYSSGLINGSFFVLRIILIVTLTTLLTISTSTIKLNSGLESLLKPLKFILPVSEIALMISLTLRFVPTLALETNKILKAQSSRGVDFSEGSIIQKIKQVITLLIPMFVVSFKRAEDLANAMEARGFAIGQKRTSLDELKFRLPDIIGFVLVISFLIIVILGNILWW